MKSERRKYEEALVFVILFATLIFVSIGCASATTIYVPDNYPTILQAVNNAIANDTIIVRDGTYTETVDVNVNNLTIKSENGSTSTIVRAMDSNDHVIEVTANYVNISGLTVTRATESGKAGIYLKSVEHCNITNNNALNNGYGIAISSSSSNTIINNTANSNTDVGIHLGSSNDNTLTSNTANSNIDDGISLSYSSNNSITKNNVNSNIWIGISLYNSSNNTLICNNASGNDYYGIHLEDSRSNNKIYHNNFINNTNQAYDNGNNSWDNGYPSGGNYWSTHNCTGNPSNGSQPYYINPNVIDHYPFQDPNGGLITNEDKAYSHIYEQMDKNNTESLRLIDSYVDDDPTAWVYDNDLAILALVDRGTTEDKDRAKILCDAFVWCQNHDQYFSDGRVRDGYWATNITDPSGENSSIISPGSGTGNMAWTIIALLRYYEVSNDKTYLNASIRLGNWIYDNCSDSRGAGGYTGGYDGWEPNQTKFQWKSTEHNIDVYVAFMRLYIVTGNTTWLDRAIHANKFVKAMWNESEGHFWTGTLNDGVNISKDCLPEDVNTWGLMALGNVSKYGRGIRWVEKIVM